MSMALLLFGWQALKSDRIILRRDSHELRSRRAPAARVVLKRLSLTHAVRVLGLGKADISGGKPFAAILRYAVQDNSLAKSRQLAYGFLAGR